MAVRLFCSTGALYSPSRSRKLYISKTLKQKCSILLLWLLKLLLAWMLLAIFSVIQLAIYLGPRPIPINFAPLPWTDTVCCLCCYYLLPTKIRVCSLSKFTLYNLYDQTQYFLQEPLYLCHASCLHKVWYGLKYCLPFSCPSVRIDSLGQKKYLIFGATLKIKGAKLTFLLWMHCWKAAGYICDGGGKQKGGPATAPLKKR